MSDVTPTNSTPKKKATNSPGMNLREKAPVTPYGLRGSSKLPSRYRDDYVEEPVRRQSPKKTPLRNQHQENAPAPNTSSAPRLPKAVRTLQLDSNGSNQQYTNAATKLLNEDDLLNAMPNFRNMMHKRKDIHIRDSSTPDSNDVYTADSIRPPILPPTLPLKDAYNDDLDDFQTPPSVGKIDHSHDAELARRQLPTTSRRPVDLNEEIRINLRKLKNLLSLPKSRRWVMCEFFYSGVDEQLFMGENEFLQIVRESFPNLRTMMLNRQEWRTIRSLLGKPRRCSPQFFQEERTSLDIRRKKVRQIYDDTFFRDPHHDTSDLPAKLPRPLTIGQRVYARIRSPKDGIYAGQIDAVLDRGYRVVFEKEDMLEPTVIPDCEVMLDGELELMPLSYFSETTAAKLPFSSARMNIQAQHVPGIKTEEVSVPRKTTSASHEKVGNFPVRMLVILVKLSKLIDHKKTLVRQLTELNGEAERMNLMSTAYHPSFKEKYAQVVVALEKLNRQMALYMQGIQEYSSQLIPQTSVELNPARPETLRKKCAAQSTDIVQQCNQGLNVSDPRALKLVSSLTSLLLQIRALGQQKLSPLDLRGLSEAIAEIRNQTSPKNAAWFQDYVEVHMKQIHNMMLQSGALLGS